MKVCIVSPSIFYVHINTEPRALYHIPHLYSYLRQRLPEVEVSVVDFEMEMGHVLRHEEVDEFLRIAEARLRRTDFDIVGISCWTSLHYLSTMAIARLCKRLNPDCKVVVGGYHPTFVPQDFEFPGTPVDYIVLGEGEETFRQIIAGDIPQETTPQRVQGVATDHSDLNILWDEYPYYRNTTVVGMWLSRGCPFSCAYCLDRQTKYRGYTARRAISEVQRVLALLPSLKQILLCDALFGLSKEWRREFLPLLVEMKPEVELWAETRVDLIQPEDLDLIACLPFQLDMGLEHVSHRMLSIMKKTNNPRKYMECFEAVDAYMNQKWIPHVAFLMLNYPGETSETQQEMYNYWMQYYERNPDNWTDASASQFCFYPGGEVYTNWQHYEETYGARVLYPEWWKLADPRRRTIRGAIIPSRELIESNNVSRGLEISNIIRMRSLQSKHPRLEERRPGGFERRTYRRIDPQKEAFLDNKPFQLQELSCMYEKINANLMIYNFETSAYFNASRATTDTLRATLEKGTTIDALVEQFGTIYPNPEGYRWKLRKLFWDLINSRFLTINLVPRLSLPVPPDRPRVVLKTTAGRIVLELFGTELPKTVANFLYLVRIKFYDRLYFHKTLPETFVQVGAWAYIDDNEGPGYTVEYEPGPFPHERGSVSMLREGPRSHGGQFFIWRSPQPQFDGRYAVFGRVVEGMASVDRILTSQDWILEAYVEGEEAVPGSNNKAAEGVPASSSAING